MSAPEIPQSPQSPRRITEISFTPFASNLEKLEQSPTKDNPEEKPRLFWVRVTRDITKLNEMQNVFKYLRGAQLSPNLKKLRSKTYFNNWRKMVTSKRWVNVATKMRDITRVAEFRDKAERVAYVRAKLARKNYTKKPIFSPDFSFLATFATNIAPLKEIKYNEELPEKSSEYEYEEEEEEEIEEIEEVVEIGGDAKNVPRIPVSASQIEADKEIGEELHQRAVNISAEENEEGEHKEEEIVQPIKKKEEQKEKGTSWIIKALIILIVIFAIGSTVLGLCPGLKEKILPSSSHAGNETNTTLQPTAAPTVEPTAEPTVVPTATDAPAATPATEEGAAAANSIPTETANAGDNNLKKEL